MDAGVEVSHVAVLGVFLMAVGAGYGTTAQLTGSDAVGTGLVPGLGDSYTPPQDRKVAVIVLDGADWRVIRTLWEDDELPNLRRMQEEGVAADLQTPSAFSPVSWTKMATGRTKEHLGINRSWSYSTSTGQTRIDSRPLKYRRFWSYLNAAGVETGIYHWLITWPVQPVDGFMLSGLLTGDLDTMAFPPDMKLSQEERRRSLQGLKAFDVADTVIDEYGGLDVLAFGFTVSDKIQHNFWRFLGKESERAAERRELIYEPYREVDDLVGRLRPEYTVIVVSDHGFHEMDRITYEARINRLLEKVDLTAFQNTPDEYLANEWEFSQDAPIVHRVADNRILNTTHYRVRFQWMNREVPRTAIRDGLSRFTVSGGTRFLQDITYRNGSFWATMYLDPDRMPAPQMSRRYTHLAYARGKIPVMNQSLIVTYGDRNMTAWIGPEKNGDHSPGTNGIFLAAGDGIARRGFIGDDNIEAEDIMPLILYLKGVSLPTRINGTVPESVIDRTTWTRQPVERTDKRVLRNTTLIVGERSDAQSSRLKDRLSELGYLR